MQFTTIAALFAATASAAVMKRADPTSYAVTEFFAGCIPHSTFCSYQFTVDATTNCTAFLQGPDYLPAVALTGCEDPAYSWAVATADDQSSLTLTITTVSTADAASNVTLTHAITADELTITNGGSVQTQSYVGPQDFAVDTTA